MNFFHYENDRLFAERVPLASIAERYGTPCYVYSRAALEAGWRAFDDALSGLEHRICYSVKANSNLGVLDCLARLGSGFDIVSGGELERVLAAGGDAAHVVFSGVGKSEAEMRRALQAGVYCFNVESQGELERLDAVAGALAVKAPVSLRVNPDVDAATHPYIATGLKKNKFGVPIGEAPALFGLAASLGNIAVKGVDFHIGSQITSLAPFVDALERVLALIDSLAESGIAITHLNVGGGLGVRYGQETPPSARDYAGAIAERLAGRRLVLLVEPGRAIAADAGILLARVEYLKLGGERNFAVVDAAMNDLLRPALYDAWQEILAVDRADASDREMQLFDVVGPVCESADFLGKDRRLALREGDLIAVATVGAYGFVMSSNYNTRPRAAEVMVDGDAMRLVRARENVSELFAGESRLPD
ncbi:MAG: diaminopimelate decarboxylase [Gammaproteobacteria bacterium]|nr:diaminopimelate decarboxylase [Gammaproteobacteria bacterium]NIP89835.1 diaminopimelate decarboxylase [Gammaproteobacteria bacterium]NIR22343.1 diaminopimelate decarboxylase [Gammaproteobacteria bacterium]NIS06348.1 diaminopimelate decarboxylase [Gammaproteobacteria bacterium]NIV45993.1 diaminopimelate decarboxylase [Gammaproteobacteria bacterium]